MELTPKLNEKVMEAVQAALKDVKPRPAVDHILAMRTTGKWAKYVQYLTEYGPNVYGVIYVGLPELKVTVHDPEHRSSKVWAGKERRRRARQEAKLKKAEAKATKKADKQVIYDPELSTLGADNKATKPTVKVKAAKKAAK